MLDTTSGGDVVLQIEGRGDVNEAKRMAISIANWTIFWNPWWTEVRSVHKEHSDCRAQAGAGGGVTSEAAVSGTFNGPSCLGKTLADIYKPQGPQAKLRLS